MAKEKIKVTCGRCEKAYLIPSARAEELWPEGFEDQHAGYLCNQCDEELEALQEQ